MHRRAIPCFVPIVTFFLKLRIERKRFDWLPFIKRQDMRIFVTVPYRSRQLTRERAPKQSNKSNY